MSCPPWGHRSPLITPRWCCMFGWSLQVKHCGTFSYCEDFLFSLNFWNLFLYMFAKQYIDGIVCRNFPSFKVFIEADNLFKSKYRRTFHLWGRNLSHALIYSKNINLNCAVIIMGTISLCVLLFWDICTFA